MDLVIDANVLFSILIKKGKTEEILFETGIHAFAPGFIFEEFEKYKGSIIEKTGRTAGEFEALLSILRKSITTVPLEETDKYLSEARKISPDEKDVQYFSLALMLRCPIWSQDKALKEQQKVVRIYSTEDLARMFFP
ncbi:MAG: PIN domain-containing protein [Nanoarchaeota archaeon]